MNIIKIFSIMENKPSPGFGTALLFSTIAALFELSSLISIIPVMSLIAGDVSGLAVRIYSQLFAINLSEANKLIILSCSISIILMITSSFVNILALYITNKFGFRSGHNLSITLYKNPTAY